MFVGELLETGVDASDAFGARQQLTELTGDLVVLPGQRVEVLLDPRNPLRHLLVRDGWRPAQDALSQALKHVRRVLLGVGDAMSRRRHLDREC